MDHPAPNPTVLRLIAELLEWFGTAEQIVTHMRASSDPPPSNEEIATTLTALLEPTLGPLIRRNGEATYAIAADALARVSATVGDEILLVPHPNRAARRAKRRRRDG
jgi:hypothetical protein